MVDITEAPRNLRGAVVLIKADGFELAYSLYHLCLAQSAEQDISCFPS